MSNSIPEIEDADLLFIFGYNGADSHPIVARRIVRAKEKGATLITVDPRVTETARISDMHLPIKGGTNMILVNAFGNVLINENLYDEEFIKEHTDNFEEYKKIVEPYTPEYAAKYTNIPADMIRKTMREYAKAKDAMILYGFLSKDDLEIFKLLITVSGIGPKGGLAILSTLPADDLRFAILSGDSKAISKAPGIGAKTAQRVILDLKDKLSLEDAFEKKLENQASGAAVSMNSSVKNDAVMALNALGYSSTESLKAVSKVDITEDMDVEDVLKLALKNMG